MANLHLRLLAAWAWSIGAYAFVDYGNVYPVQLAPGGTVKLSPEHPLATLDYGTEVAGFPFFEVAGNTSAQIEVKYSESYPPLHDVNADGPWTFSNGLANTWRVETFNITGGGHVQSFFVQGGQRFQSIPTSEHTDVDELKGYLDMHDYTYNNIFGLGGRVVQVACVDAGNAPSTWELTNEGALIRGQATAQSSSGALMGAANYTLEFDTKIVRGGTGWRVASAIQPLGPYFVLTSNYPEGSTFLNTNKTLLPPNTLIFNSDWNLANQSTLTTPANQYYPLNVSVEENKWYHVVTAIQENGYSISLNGEKVAFVPLPPPGTNRFNTPSRYQGTWGFGGYQDQVAVFSNVSVVASNKTRIYSNDMKSEAVLAEYAVAPLADSVCLDGAKRDRLLWIGDFYHTVRVLALSSARWDYITGSIDIAFSYQSKSGPFAGFVPISARLGTRPEYVEADPAGPGLVDYQDLFLAAIGEYYRYTGDFEGLKKHWESIKMLVKARVAYVNPDTGLVGGSPEVPNPASFLGPGNGSAVTGLMSFTLQLIEPLARAAQDMEIASLCNATAIKLQDGLNKHLWNPELGTYSLSVESPGNYSLTGIAWAILSGAANETQAKSSIAKLEGLRFGPGYKTISSDEETPDYELAPNPSGFLLEALFDAYHKYDADSKGAVSHLLDDLWGSMVNNNSYYSGASWEYVKPDGTPGIDAFTSLAHPWGAAPTYVLPEYLLGVRTKTAGYKTFYVQPALGYLDLKNVSGRVPTPYGAINVTWAINANEAQMQFDVPTGTSGEMMVPRGWKVAGKQGANATIELLSGHVQVTLHSS